MSQTMGSHVSSFISGVSVVDRRPIQTTHYTVDVDVDVEIAVPSSETEHIIIVAQWIDRTTHTHTCKVGTTRKDQRDIRQGQNQARRVKFKIGEEEIETVRDFKYLGRITSDDDDDDDLPAVRENMKKARKRWARVSRLLVREGATAKMMGKIYLAIVQSVVLYGSETWVLSERMRRMLEGFHNRCARQMTRKENGLHPQLLPH
jgi:hypothetical protein